EVAEKGRMVYPLEKTSLAARNYPADRSGSNDSCRNLGTIVAAIGMFACTCVGGRALPLAAAPQATRVGSGGRFGSMGGSRDSAWNRRDGSGVRPQIAGNAGRADRPIARAAHFGFRDNPP